MSELKKTPLNPYYHESGVKVIDFGGWELPVQFSSIKDEHNAVRKSAGMFEVSHMGEIKVSGNDAEKFLNYVLTNDVSKLSDTKAQYTFLCNEHGGVIDDLVIYRLKKEEYLLVVNAGNTDKDYEWLSKIDGFDVAVTNVSSKYGQIAVQGPEARKLVQKVVHEDLSGMKLFTFKQNIDINGMKVILSQSGYTGEDGFEIYCSSEDTPALWKIFKDEGVLECGLGARDTLRLEAGLPLHGQDLSESITPIEANMGFAVKLNKGDFIGRAVLEREKNEGPKRRLSGFELTGKGIARTGYEVFSEDGLKGTVTSGTQSPSSKRSIGFALIDSDFFELDKTFTIKVRSKDVPAVFVKTPFHKN